VQQVQAVLQAMMQARQVKAPVQASRMQVLM
jgi:hypothetical protein